MIHHTDCHDCLHSCHCLEELSAVLVTTVTGKCFPKVLIFKILIVKKTPNNCSPLMEYENKTMTEWPLFHFFLIVSIAIISITILSRNTDTSKTLLIKVLHILGGQGENFLML